jgi:hypothetical protein
VTGLHESLAELGPYFALASHEQGSVPSGTWRPLRGLLESPDQLRERADAVRAALARGAERPVELRTAASIAQLGLVARLVAPAIGTAVLTGRLLSMDDAWWQPVLGGPMPLSVPREALDGASYDGPLGQALGRGLLDGPVRALVEITAKLSVSRQVLWGNVASAVNGAAAMVVTQRPDLAVAALDLARALLDQPVLKGTSTGVPAADFRRLSCCLLYRIGASAPKIVCGDCVLRIAV